MTGLLTTLENAKEGSQIPDDVLHDFMSEVGDYVWYPKNGLWFKAGRPTEFGKDFNPFCSLDDALSLVPEGWGTWQAFQRNTLEKAAGRWTWDLFELGARLSEDFTRYGGTANTPALALCIAILRAGEQ